MNAQGPKNGGYVPGAKSANRQNYNLPKSADSRSPETPKEKEKAIIEAFRHFQMI